MLKQLGSILIQSYQSYITVLTPSLCNYQLTCSQYAKQAIKTWGIVDGSILARRYLKSCERQGKSLRKIGITKKHYLPGVQVPSKKPIIEKKEYIQLFCNVLTYTLLGPLTLFAILHYNLGFSLVLCFYYLIVLILSTFLKIINRKLKILKTLLILNLLPIVCISFPSIILATIFTTILEPSPLESQIGIDNNNKKLYLSLLLALFGFGLLYFIPLLGSIIILASYLINCKIQPNENGKLINLFGLYILIIATIAFYFNPILALPAVIIWWESNK
jgi:uncharacterized protein